MLTDLGDGAVDLADYAGFVPGLAVSVVLAFLLCGWLSRPLAVGRATAWSLIVSVGMVLAATITPSRDAIASGAVGTGRCDLSGLGAFSPLGYLGFNDLSLNVLLFIPLGVVVALLPRSRYRLAVVAAAIALPFAVEGIQLLAVSLGRGCQASDIRNNLTGLLVGAALGLAWLALRHRRSSV
jgi:hypothetical protein